MTGAGPPGGAGAMPALLAREAASLVARLRVWQPSRWQASAGPFGSRGDLVHHLAQDLADLAGEAGVRLPRLDSDLALPDQLAVTADDLVRTRPDDGLAGRAVAHLLLHRADLLGEPVPAGLVEALGAGDAAGLLRRAHCRLGPTGGRPPEGDRPPVVPGAGD